MSANYQDTTITKLNTIAETTANSEVRVIAQTMSKYVREHEKEHRTEVTQEMGFVTPVVVAEPKP